MKVLSNNYHPDSIFGLFVGREMIIKNLSLTSRKKCIEKYNFEGDMMPFTWRVCAKIRGPPVPGQCRRCVEQGLRSAVLPADILVTVGLGRDYQLLEDHDVLGEGAGLVGK